MTKQEQLLDELVECEIRRRQLEERAATLREELGLTGTRPKQSRHISPAGRARIAEAQRRRWAATEGKKAQQGATPQAAALKKRWAAFRAGTGPRPGAKEGLTPVGKPERKKVEWTPAMRKKAAERMRRVNREMAKKRAVAKAA